MAPTTPPFFHVESTEQASDWIMPNMCTSTQLARRPINIHSAHDILTKINEDDEAVGDDFPSANDFGWLGGSDASSSSRMANSVERAAQEKINHSFLSRKALAITSTWKARVDLARFSSLLGHQPHRGPEACSTSRPSWVRVPLTAWHTWTWPRASFVEGPRTRAVDRCIKKPQESRSPTMERNGSDTMF